MRHGRRRYRIGSRPSHRKALLRNLGASLIAHGKIRTTHAKCKAVQPFVERLVTLAKTDTVANRRKAFARLRSAGAVRRLFDEVAPAHRDRAGGYTRVVKTAVGRVGDNAPTSYICLV